MSTPPTLYYTCAYRHLRPSLWDGVLTPPPIMVAASTCYVGGRLRVRPYPVRPADAWADCGGFYFANKYQDYPFTRREFLFWLYGMRPAYAAPMDYPCEEEIAPDEAAVRLRQEATTRNALALMGHVGTWKWVPTIQGRTLEQYVQHARDYQAVGLVRPYMAIGSLCRRTAYTEIESIVATLAAELPGVRFHLFGVKLAILSSPYKLHPAIRSLDTGAWGGRFGTDIPVFNEAMAKLGKSQAATEIAWAMPRYAEKIATAVSLPKRMRRGGFLVDQDARRPLAYFCAFCDSRLDESDLADLTPEEAGEIAPYLAAGRCPCCQAPIRDPALPVAPPRPRRRRAA